MMPNISNQQLRPEKSVAGKLKAGGLKLNTERLINLVVILIVLATGCLVSSCNTTKNAIYFKNITNDTTLSHLVSKDFEPKIRKGDLLGITVSSLSPDNTVLYNAPQNIQGTIPGFLVDSSGNINFFKLGSVHAEGLTRTELKDKLQKELTPYLAQNVVAVGFLNRHVTLIGAISPSVLPLPNDNMTIFDALASGGDISDKAQRDNVMVIREEENSRVFKKLDLTNESVFYSPYFYLKPNDIIYVKPLIKKEKVSATQIISYVTAAISLFLLISTRFIK